MWVKLFDLEYIKNGLQQFHIKESYCAFTCALSLVVYYTCVKFHQYWFIHLWEVTLRTNMEIWMDRSRSTYTWRVIKHLTMQVLLYRLYLTINVSLWCEIDLPSRHLVEQSKLQPHMQWSTSCPSTVLLYDWEAGM